MLCVPLSRFEPFGQIANLQIGSHQLVEAQLPPDHVGLKCVANRKGETECCQVNGFLLQFHPEDALFEYPLKRCHFRLLPVVLALPKMHEPPKRPDKKNPGTTCRIQNALLTYEILVRHHIVEHERGDHWRSKYCTFALLRKMLIDVT